MWWRSVPALIHLDGDRQACIKTGLIPAGHLQGIALFYPAYAPASVSCRQVVPSRRIT
uniref:Uncharacterized protein n=1 Tax=Klebsiella pneumoniae TaxID=573 RepID=A0A223LMZ1_KLEPN|nr:Hypothetical protein [Klebsiella pneumoniae]